MANAFLRPRSAALVATPLLWLTFASSASAQEPEVVDADAPEDSPLSLSMFADAYLTFQSNEPGSGATDRGHRAFAGQGPNLLSENGFSLSFLGLDATYEAGDVSATTSLRFGSSVPIFHGNDAGSGFDNILQGYLSWTPGGGALSLDMGMFGTIFGAEVSESWQNLNYTRGALYYYGQPFWHTGLRASYAVSDQLGLTFMVVNGTNDISETFYAGSAEDQTPTIAAQVSYSPSDSTSIVVGGMRALDVGGNDDFGFDTFFDVVATLELGAASVVLNADYVITDQEDQDLDARTFLGLSGGVGYALSETFGVAGRVEYLTDDSGDGEDAWTLITATGTLDYKATPNLIVRLDGRFETASDDTFAVQSDASPEGFEADPTDSWFAGVLGVVVTTDP